MLFANFRTGKNKLKPEAILHCTIQPEMLHWKTGFYISVIIFYNTPLLFSCRVLLQFLASNKQLTLSNWKIFASLKLAACWHIWSCAAACASENERTVRQRATAILQLGCMKLPRNWKFLLINSLFHPKSLLYILTLLLKADRKAMGDFNKSKLTTPKGWKATKARSDTFPF